MSSSFSEPKGNDRERVVEESDSQAYPRRESGPQGMHKVWTIDDALEYAPPKPETDVWDMLLDPLMRQDKMQCKAWKDEVQNLLIFAGLFSAVVTAFIIETYKELQLDPDDQMVVLLAHIAARLDNATATAAAPRISEAYSFTPSASAVRVNACWFVSLVLSLTTVLVGIIALQWLREHQAYPADLTPRQRYALCVMRTDALRAWRVPTVFTTLPLLLQCALILFLAGVIDFLRAIGVGAVLGPVAIVVGLTLTFLGATTVLPALQVWALHFNLPPVFERESGDAGAGAEATVGGSGSMIRKVLPPSRCPYRSPQAHAVRSLWRNVLSLAGRFKSDRPGVKLPFLPRFNSSHFRPAGMNMEGPDSHFTRYVNSAMSMAKWTQLDLQWLVIRDGYMRRFYQRSARLEEIRHTGDTAPIYDVVAGLRTWHKNTHTTFETLYHAFEEVSKATLNTVIAQSPLNIPTRKRCVQNAYLNDLLSAGEKPSLAEYFVMHTPYDYSSTGGAQMSPQSLVDILHHQNLVTILESDIPADGDLALRATRVAEIKIRLMRCLYEMDITVQPSRVLNDLPRCLVLCQPDVAQIATAQTQRDRDAFKVITWQMGKLSVTLLDQIRKGPREDSFAHNAVAQESLRLFFEAVGYCAAQCLELGESSRGLKDECRAVFAYVEGCLRQEMSSWAADAGTVDADGGGTLGTTVRPSLAFYVSALFAYAAIHHSHWKAAHRDAAFVSMVAVICAYRKQTVDLGLVDDDMESRLCGNNLYKVTDLFPFTMQWWDDLSIPQSRQLNES